MPIAKPRACSASMKGGIDLQQRLAAGQDHVAVGVVAGPLPGDDIGEFVRRGVAAAERAVGADKVGIAELAGGAGAVLFAAAPEVAAGKTAKHRRAAGMRAFALQGQEDLFDRVTHYLSSDRISPVIAEPGLPQRLAQCHGRRHGHIERAQTRPDRDHQPRIGSGGDLVGDPCGFPPEQQDIVPPVAEIQIGTGPLGRKQHQPETRLVTPLLEF